MRMRDPTPIIMGRSDLARPRSQLPERFDAIPGGGMGGEESAAARACRLHQPRQGIDHDFLGLPDALEQDHPVLVRLVFLFAAIAPADQCASDRSDLATP